MSLIAKVACLDVCNRCHGLHARVIFSDGSKSKDFASEETGFTVIGEAHEKGKVTDDEARVLMEQIALSPLPVGKGAHDAFLELYEYGPSGDTKQSLETFLWNASSSPRAALLS